MEVLSAPRPFHTIRVICGMLIGYENRVNIRPWAYPADGLSTGWIGFFVWPMQAQARRPLGNAFAFAMLTWALEPTPKYRDTDLDLKAVSGDLYYQLCHHQPLFN
jgi:hypothetical protein